MFAKVLRALAALTVVSSAPLTADAEPPPIFVGGQFIRQHAIQDERGHVLVPVRGVFAALGAAVDYTPPRFVIVRRNGAIIAGLIIGRRTAIVANRGRYLETAPVRLADRVYVPLRGIAEIAGAQVQYSSHPRLVDIRVPFDTVSASRLTPAGAPPDDRLPPWVYLLVGIFVLGFFIELGRRLAASPRPARASSRRAVAALPPGALQFPNTTRPGHQNGIGKIRK